ncbi:MAG: type II toxin-antitoxin system Phd/YefM family antitoxin [Phycisphaerales bacterium]
MHLLPEVCTYTDFRDNLTAHLARLKKAKRATLVTRNGRAAAVVLSPEDYERLVYGTTLREGRAKVARGLAQARAGKTRSIQHTVEHLEKSLSMNLRPEKKRKRAA